MLFGCNRCNHVGITFAARPQQEASRNIDVDEAGICETCFHHHGPDIRTADGSFTKDIYSPLAVE